MLNINPGNRSEIRSRGFPPARYAPATSVVAKVTRNRRNGTTGFSLFSFQGILGSCYQDKILNRESWFRT
jgi:hypothetical protein